MPRVSLNLRLRPQAVPRLERASDTQVTGVMGGKGRQAKIVGNHLDIFFNGRFTQELRHVFWRVKAQVDRGNHYLRTQGKIPGSRPQGFSSLSTS